MDVRIALVLLTLSASVVIGCDKKATPVTKTEAQQPAAVQPEAKKGFFETVSEPSFTISSTKKTDYRSGELSSFALDIAPKGKWHLNEEFPTRIVVSAADNIKLPKAEFAKSDAELFTKDKASFEMRFNAPKGEHLLIADVAFAVCTEKTCLPEQRQLAVKIEVN